MTEAEGHSCGSAENGVDLRAAADEEALEAIIGEAADHANEAIETVEAIQGALEEANEGSRCRDPALCSSKRCPRLVRVLAGWWVGLVVAVLIPIQKG
jgi:hypothetical protein